MRRVIGLMSGTSLDGVDAAWIETDGIRIGRLGPRLTIPYAPALQGALRRLIGRAGSLAPDDAELLRLTRALSSVHAEAVAAIGEPAELIGMHGQTILHRPETGLSWQIGDAAWLAAATGLPVVHDFRSSDIAAGGQGAPLAPVFHAALAAGMERPLAILNLGGVANVTWLGPAGEITALDTGPGNGPLDDWVRAMTGRAFDAEGRLAASGRADRAMVERLLAHPWFARPGPKSLDRLAFSSWLEENGLRTLGAADGAATLACFTAGAVALAPLPSPPRRWLISGGGRHNRTLMTALQQTLGAVVEPVEAAGWDGDALEAQCFGFLAARVVSGLPLSFPGTTGVATPQCGGRVAEPRRELRLDQGTA